MSDCVPAFELLLANDVNHTVQIDFMTVPLRAGPFSFLG